VLRREVTAWSPDAALLRDPMRVDTSLLASGRRDVTTAVAGWLRTRVLGDGSQPSGVRFTSKHGQNLVCWAVWVPLLGETGQNRVPSAVGKFVTADPRCRCWRERRAAHRRQAAPRLLAKITAVEGDPSAVRPACPQVGPSQL